MGRRTAAVLSVLRNATLRRIEFAFLAFSVAEWATWLAIVVFAYDRGGATEAGLIAFVQLVPSVIVAPAAATLGDRFPRARVLIGSYVVQGVAMAATAIALVDGAPLLVYVLATVTATSITVTRPVQGAFLPEVVSVPEELTAANVASGTVEGAGAFVGPILAGVLLAVGGPALVFVVCSIGILAGALAIAPVARRARPTSPALIDEPGDVAGVDVGGLDHLAAGAVAIIRDRRLMAITVLLTFSLGLVGALDIFYAVLAIELLGLGDSGVGFLGAATGLGALVGSVLAVLLVGRTRLTAPLLLASTAFGGAVAAVAVAPGALGAAILLGIAGVGSSIMYVAIQTLTQRIAGDDVLSRVFGVEEALMMAAQSVGALAVPILLVALTPDQALVVAGLSLPIATLLVAPILIRADRVVAGRGRELATLLRVPMFQPLSAPVLERLAADATWETVGADEVVVREGEPGDRFFVIESGRVRVSVGGTPIRESGHGDSFGEIALLRDVPRTATIHAIEPASLLVVERTPFLEALTGQPRSRALASTVIADRLASAPAARPVDGAGD